MKNNKKTSITKRIFCLALGICMCLSLSLFAKAIEPLDGPINADDNAQLVTPTLEISSVPQGAVAVGYSIDSGSLTYYRVNGGILSSNFTGNVEIQGWFPQQEQTMLTEGDISTNQYIGLDDRELITNTRQTPYSAIAYMKMEFDSEGASYATAYMISKNVAITAAHCVFNQATTNGRPLEWAEEIELWPGRNGDNIFTGRPFGKATVEEIVISPTYYTQLATIVMDENDKEVRVLTQNSSQNDWALLFLGTNEDIGLDTGYFGYRYTNGQTGLNVSITGYKDGEPYQYKHSGTVIRSDIPGAEVWDQEFIMQYEIDAGDGQSGAPVYYQNSDGAWVSIGIHTTDFTHDDGTGQLNQGSRFTSQLFSFILAYTSSH